MWREMSEDRADELYPKFTECCQGFGSADVVYALGMMIADAVVLNCVDKNPEKTFELLRGVADIEIPMVKLRDASVPLQQRCDK
jgi:hypothetical protein